MPRVCVQFLPEWADPADFVGSRVVVIDVLRATSTMLQAMASGATAIVPCLTIDEARDRAAVLPAASVVLGGERGGRPIEGFDLGNSPAEYTASHVAGKTVVMTTTNGTKALLRCAAADEILIGSFGNLTAVCAHLTAADLQQTSDSPIQIVCAGTDGRVTHEDVLFAGAVVARLVGDQERQPHSTSSAGWQVDDSAAIARDAWLTLAGQAQGADLEPRLAAAFRRSRGGKNLVEIGMAGDLELASQIDRFSSVPIYRSEAGLIQ